MDQNPSLKNYITPIPGIYVIFASNYVEIFSDKGEIQEKREVLEERFSRRGIHGGRAKEGYLIHTKEYLLVDKT